MQNMQNSQRNFPEREPTNRELGLTGGGYVDDLDKISQATVEIVEPPKANDIPVSSRMPQQPGTAHMTDKKKIRQSLSEKHAEFEEDTVDIKPRRIALDEPPKGIAKNFMKKMTAPFPSVPTSLAKQSLLADRLITLDNWRMSIKAWCDASTGSEAQLWGVMEAALLDYLEHHLIRSSSDQGMSFDYSKIHIPSWAHERYAEWTSQTEYQVRAVLDENLLKKADAGWADQLEMTFCSDAGANPGSVRSSLQKPLTVVVAYLVTVHLEYGLKNADQVKQIVGTAKNPKRLIEKGHGREWGTIFQKLCLLKRAYDDHFSGNGETYHFSRFSFPERLSGARELYNYILQAPGCLDELHRAEFIKLGSKDHWHLFDVAVSEAVLDEFYAYFQRTICKLPSVIKWNNAKHVAAVAKKEAVKDEKSEEIPTAAAAKGKDGKGKGKGGDGKAGKSHENDKGTPAKSPKGKGKGSQIVERDGKKYFVTKTGEEREVGMCWVCKDQTKCPNKDVQGKYCDMPEKPKISK